MAGIFRSYDIRGLLNEIGAHNIGRLSEAIVAYMQKERQTGIVVGTDMRAYSSLMADSLSSRALDAGLDILRVADGKNLLCSTSLFNYVTSLNPKMAGVMVTASHNPKEYHGYKINLSESRQVTYGKGIEIIEELYEHRTAPRYPSEKGRMSCRYPLEKMIKESCDKLGLEKNAFKGARVAFECANGMSSREAKEFLRYLGADVKYLNDWFDGSFPVVQGNPAVEKNLSGLKSLVVNCDYDIGFMGDADFDRIGVVDKKGRKLHAHETATILAMNLHNNGAREITGLYTQTLGRSFRDTIRSMGGEAFMTPVGRGLVIDRGLGLMQKGRNCVLGAENSYHFMEDDIRRKFYENAFLVIGGVLQFFYNNDGNLSKAKSDYVYLGERNYDVERDKIAPLLHKAKSVFRDLIKGGLTETDGVFVENEQAGKFISMRASNTEDIVRLNAEARTKKELDEIDRGAENLIYSFGGKPHAE